MTVYRTEKASDTRPQMSGYWQHRRLALQLEREISLILACKCRHAGRQASTQRCPLNPAQ